MNEIPAGIILLIIMKFMFQRGIIEMELRTAILLQSLVRISEEYSTEALITVSANPPATYSS